MFVDPSGHIPETQSCYGLDGFAQSCNEPLLDGIWNSTEVLSGITLIFDDHRTVDVDRDTDDPVKDVGEFIKDISKMVENGIITDTQAMMLMFTFSYYRAERDFGELSSNPQAAIIQRKNIFNRAVNWVASSFYRGIAGTLSAGGVQNYGDQTPSFGVSGFDWRYVGSRTNLNQIQHFFAEAAIYFVWGKVIGGVGVWWHDKGNSPEAVADRELGYLAGWWVHAGWDDPIGNLETAITIIEEGLDPP
jgi:hypothetical protein